MPSAKGLSRFVLFTMLACNLSYSEIYKWTDEKGKVHYSQTPPSESAEKIDIPSTTETPSNTNNGINAPASNIENQKKYSDYLEQERLERKEKREQKKQQKAEAREKCHRVRAELEDMNQGGILYYELGEDGERNVVDETRINARKEKLRKYLRSNCGGA